jgi:hypothetical protein
MRRVLRCVGLALALALLPAAVAQDKKAAEDKNPPKDKKEAVDKLVVGGEISGKLIHWEGAGKYFTVQVQLVYYVPNAGQVKRIADNQAAMARATKPQDVLYYRNQIADAQMKLYDKKEEHHSIEFQAGSEMKYRILNPVVYDEKGKPKKLTKKELDELKGPDKKLPGYNGEASDVHQDSIVTVYLPKKKATKPAAGKDDKGLADAARPEAVMLLVVADAPPPK